jgi:hypothetical protein
MFMYVKLNVILFVYSIKDFKKKDTALSPRWPGFDSPNGKTLFFLTFIVLYSTIRCKTQFGIPFESIHFILDQAVGTNVIRHSSKLNRYESRQCIGVISL